MVGPSWPAAEFPAGGSKQITANDKSAKAGLNPILFLKAHLLFFGVFVSEGR
jgi:hypothetical protein